jgi:hypothetical protein
MRNPPPAFYQVNKTSTKMKVKISDYNNSTFKEIKKGIRVQFVLVGLAVFTSILFMGILYLAG